MWYVTYFQSTHSFINAFIFTYQSSQYSNYTEPNSTNIRLVKHIYYVSTHRNMTKGKWRGNRRTDGVVSNDYT